MPKFECTIRQDAWQYWLITVEANDAEKAAELARKAWKTGDPKLVESGVDGFDHAECEAEDCELVDDDGNPTQPTA